MKPPYDHENPDPIVSLVSPEENPNEVRIKIEVRIKTKLAITMLCWVILAVPIGVVALRASRSSESNAPLLGYKVDDARIAHSVEIARRVWAQRHKYAHCHGHITTVVVWHQRELSPPPHKNEFVEADTPVIGGCGIQYSQHTYYEASWSEFCITTVHEYGHVVGYPDEESNRHEIMYYRANEGSFHLPACQNPSDKVRYKPPVETPADVCVFLVDHHLEGFSFSNVRGCRSEVTAPVSHDIASRLKTEHCVDVVDVTPLPDEQTFFGRAFPAWSLRLANPQVCHVVQVDLVALGKPSFRTTIKEAELPPESYYQRPSIVFEKVR